MKQENYKTWKSLTEEYKKLMENINSYKEDNRLLVKEYGICIKNLNDPHISQGLKSYNQIKIDEITKLMGMNEEKISRAQLKIDRYSALMNTMETPLYDTSNIH